MRKYKTFLAYRCFQGEDIELSSDGKYYIFSDRIDHIFIHVETCKTLTSPDNYYA